MKTPRSPLDALFGKADLRCTLCNASHGTCDCWVKCECGWTFEKNTKCPGPAHGGKGKPLRSIAYGKARL